MKYDHQNIFAKILRGDIPCEKIYDDEYVLAFNDISRMTPVHVLVIPRNSYTDLYDFIKSASDDEIVGFWQGVEKTAKILKVETGFNLFTSIGSDHSQDVFHFHVHITSGKTLENILRDN